MPSEYTLLVRNRMNHLTHFSPENNEEFLQACETYIDRLRKNGNLKAAQPMDREGKSRIRAHENCQD